MMMETTNGSLERGKTYTFVSSRLKTQHGEVKKCANFIAPVFQFTATAVQR
jgi:hypothetical protein